MLQKSQWHLIQTKESTGIDVEQVKEAAFSSVTQSWLWSSQIKKGYGDIL